MKKIAPAICLLMLFCACSRGPAPAALLPVGVFDSGTGGLTVLEKILTLDEFDNASGAPGADGIPDFADEDFQYLADQANMPYGVYDAQGKADLLRRLVRDDAGFLLGDSFWSEDGAELSGSKAPCKILVIACNTATAYGLEDVWAMLEGSGTRVIGVINAGVKATLDLLEGDPGEKAAGPLAIGVLATPGTISSGAYERTIREELSRRGSTREVEVVNQAGYGFAEAVDAEPDYVNPSLTEPRGSYRGPRIGTSDASIKEELLPVYNFAPEGLLYRQAKGVRLDLQLNSAANYARFNMVSLIERHRLSGSRTPIRAIILGCTHYPFEIATLERVIAEMRDYSKDGAYPYRELLPEDLVLVDPARYTAIECYESLRADGLLHPGRQDNTPSRQASASQTSQPRTVRAFISIPAPGLDAGLLSPEGGLSFEYKYGRDALADDSGTRQVLFSDGNISPATRERISALLPACAGEIFP